MQINILDILGILSPFLLAVIGGLGWLYRHEREKRSNIEKTLFDKKYNIYMKIVNLFFEAISNVDGNNSGNTDQKELMNEINKELLMYGPDEVIKIFYEWTQAARRGKNNLQYLGKIFINIRKDMGYPKTKINEIDFLKQLIIDYDQAKTDGII